ncbi:hypothetical protein CVT25_005953 [Psilocybe cyanescens]|uniref:PXA domain-containing protein n=1 Tax=Psilocybe cyanescens TaxID=93625 RepID=A0A409VM69_PSICY|nr:hypothetical protein CVT25_005953 [Psilocybe cyanescens]
MPPSLASRLLFHAAPVPVLFESKNVSHELTPEIYDFVALSLRAYVSPWWSKITRYDKDFLPHISAVFTTVIRALDHRIQSLDISDLVFHDAPAIITQHYRDYRNAAAKTQTAYATGGAASLPSLFAHLQPHMAISPDGVLNREYYRQIVDQILKACLPPEEYEPESERLIIREVIVKVLIDDVIPKITQPWFINRTILDLMGPPEEPIYVSQPPVPPSTSTSHTFIVIALSLLQSFSGMCLALIHTYKQAMSTIKLVQQTPPRTPQPPPAPFVPPAPEPVIRASSLTSPLSTTSSISSNTFTSAFPTITVSPAPPSLSEQQSYADSPLILLSELISAQERYSSTITLTIMSMIAASMTPFLDKLLPHMLHNFLSPAFILNTTRTAKRTMFPNGYPGPQPSTPSPEEQAEWRARLVSWKGTGGVALLLPLLLGPDPSKTLEAALDPLSDLQCNLRLVVFLLDRILVGLFPELSGSQS